MQTVIQVYSDVVKAGLILPRKAKYTKTDLNSVIVDSLFRGGRTLTEREAVFIIKCSAAYHGTLWSRSISNPQP